MEKQANTFELNMSPIFFGVIHKGVKVLSTSRDLSDVERKDALIEILEDTKKKIISASCTVREHESDDPLYKPVP